LGDDQRIVVVAGELTHSLGAFHVIRRSTQ
jgi:hypothetical protein